jgi:hypothetical protein
MNEVHNLEDVYVFRSDMVWLVTILREHKNIYRKISRLYILKLRRREHIKYKIKLIRMVIFMIPQDGN